MTDFLYVCDGAVPSCKRTVCHWFGLGDCMHTSDPDHARYGEPRVFADMNGDGSILVEKVRAEDR